MNETELKRAIAEKAKTAGLESGRSAYAEMLVELVEPNHLALDLFSRFLPTRTLNPGDTLVKRLRRGRYMTQTMVPGTAHLVSQVSYSDHYSWVFDRLITGARESIWNLRNNPVLTAEKLRIDLRNDLVDNLVGRVFDLLATVWNSTDTPSNFVETGNLTAAQLDSLMENVLEKAGNISAIMGTRRALLPIYNFAGFREYLVGGTTATGFDIPEILLERYRTNRVASYNGAPLIEVPQVYSMNLGDASLRTKLIPDDKIVVIGQNAGEFVLYGAPETQDYTDMTLQPADYVVHTWQSYGLAVDDVEMIGVIHKIT